MARLTSPFTIPILIVLVSMLGATVSWRASVWSGTAAGLDDKAAQELLVAQDARTADLGQVAQDLRIFERYRARRQLASIARRKGALAGEAQDHAAAALALSRMMTASSPSVDGEGVAYDTGAALGTLASQKPDLAQADPRYLASLAADAHDKQISLVLIGLLFICTLFVLTLSQVSGLRLRRWFAGCGVALGLAATLWFLLQTSPLPTV